MKWEFLVVEKSVWDRIFSKHNFWHSFLFGIFIFTFDMAIDILCGKISILYPLYFNT